LLLQVQAQQPTQTQNPEVGKTIIINIFKIVRQGYFAKGMSGFNRLYPKVNSLKCGM
jgi:hypothetical protein